MGGACSTAYKILVGKPLGKRPLGKQRHMWKDNIKMDMNEGVVWIHLAQDRVQWSVSVNTVMNVWVPRKT